MQMHMQKLPNSELRGTASAWQCCASVAMVNSSVRTAAIVC